MQSDALSGIAAWEPRSGFSFPDDEMPEPIENKSFFGPVKALPMTRSAFMRLTRVPIVIYYGDYIPREPTDNPYQDYWRAASSLAERWVALINRLGGKASLVQLPEVGLHGNSHFPFAEKNNLDVAAFFESWLAANTPLAH